jgi:hypothetical protein
LKTIPTPFALMEQPLMYRPSAANVRRVRWLVFGLVFLTLNSLWISAQEGETIPLPASPVTRDSTQPQIIADVFVTPSTDNGNRRALFIGDYTDFTDPPPDDFYPDSRTLLRFDLSGIPNGATVTAATLKLWHYGTNAGHGEIEVRRITSGWSENTTWDNQPNYNNERYGQTLFPTYNGPPQQRDIPLDPSLITHMMQQNHGMMLRNIDESKPGVVVCSRDSDGWCLNGFRPQLSVTFNVATPTPTFTPTPCGFGKPVLISPADGAQLNAVDADLPLSWQYVCDAIRYKVKVKNKTTGEVVFKQNFTPEEAICDNASCRHILPALSPENNTTYSWKVVAWDAGGKKKKSDGATFDLIRYPLPEPFDLTSPCNSGTTMHDLPTFKWNESANAVEYKLSLMTVDGKQLLDNADSKHPASSVCTGGACAFGLGSLSVPITLKPGEGFVWRVMAINGLQKTKSPKAEFIANGPLKIVRQQAPIDGQPVDAGEKPVVAWQTDNRLNEYRVTVRVGSASGNLWEQTEWKQANELCQVNTDTEATCPAALCLLVLDKPIAANTDYFWRVEGKTPSEEKVKSGWWRFAGTP